MAYANPEMKKIKDKEYRDSHKDQLKDYFKQYHIANREKRIKANREYKEKNREKFLATLRQYYQTHKGERREYFLQNREKINEMGRKAHKRRIETDIFYRIRRTLRSRLTNALKGKGAKSQKTLELLGCSVEQLKQHLEMQFQEGMDWSNYGKHGWHVDHIIPCVSFDLFDPEQQKKCFHYTNLQPLWAEDNLKKGKTLPPLDNSPII